MHLSGETTKTIKQLHNTIHSFPSSSRSSIQKVLERFTEMRLNSLNQPSRDHLNPTFRLLNRLSKERCSLRYQAQHSISQRIPHHLERFERSSLHSQVVRSSEHEERGVEFLQEEFVGEERLGVGGEEGLVVLRDEERGEGMRRLELGRYGVGDFTQSQDVPKSYRITISDCAKRAR